MTLCVCAVCVQGDITEDVELIEGLEETKRIATDIAQKAELARQVCVCVHLCVYLCVRACVCLCLCRRVCTHVAVRLHTRTFYACLRLLSQRLCMCACPCVRTQQTQANIKITSEKYRPVANRTSLLFFLMNDLVKIHTYYIYSLAAFTLVFYRGIDLVTDKGGRKVSRWMCTKDACVRTSIHM